MRRITIRKRITGFIAVALATVFLCLLSAGAFASESFAAPSINVNATTVRLGEDIIASFPSVDNANAWIGFYKTGNTDRQYISFVYLKDASGSYKVKVSTEVGTYNFRLFGDGGYTQKLATSQTITVTTHAPSISIDRSGVQPDESVTASYTDGPASTQAWIGLYQTGNTDRQYMSYQYLSGSSGSYTVKAPKQAGQYEFRLFQDSGYTRIATSQPFTVTESPVSTQTPATPAPTAPTTTAATAQTASYDLTGKWNITANRSSGTFEITSQSGNTFSGTVSIDAGKTERLINGLITGNTVTFTRMWDSGSLRQDYTGTLSVDASSNVGISGTFTQNNAGSYNWTATKTTPISSPATPTTAPAAPAGSGAEAFESGSRIMWQPASGLGYRLFRSTSSSSLGISVTDFYITSTSFADVNVEPDTTYYYTVKPVLAEARPFEDIEEKLGSAIATFTVKTGSQVYKPGSYKHFILLKLGSPYMSVDGVNQEIDPGRGTQPLIISGRTMVPIRAIVEAMGGTVGWDAGAQKITLEARGNSVEMWLSKTDLTINGAARKMDVAPILQQGRTFVPLRFAAENLNCKVDWINSTQEAVIVYEE